MSLCPEVVPIDAMQCVARSRVLYADTDKMGIVYHATYLRYLELGRVELLRAGGLSYARMEADGFGLPVTDLAVDYRAPARYDDTMSIHVALSQVTKVRARFDYRITAQRSLQPDAPAVDVLRAQTNHCCVRSLDGRATRFPDAVWQLLCPQVVGVSGNRV
jgi:acyl-CoA thioester hydrolase